MINPLKYLRPNRKVGLALGSGGAKGLAHIGVLEYLEEAGIPVDMIAGSSIGAVVGALYCAGTLKKFRNDLLTLSWKDRLALVDPVIPKKGLLSGRKLMAFLSRYIPGDANIEDLPVRLAVVATDYTTWSPLVFEKGNVFDALRASISIPGIFTPVKFDRTLLIDGGVSNPLPIDVVKKMGAGITIAVDLHPQRKRRSLKGIARETSSSVREASAKGLEVEAGETDEGESIFSIIAGSIDIMEYVNTLLLVKYNKPAVIIQPELQDLGPLDFSEVDRAVEEGRSACRRKAFALTAKAALWAG
jgi:NTE family protein